MRVVNDKEFEAVLTLPGSERYGYCLRSIADWEEVWSLRGLDGWILAADDAGHECIPIWDHPRYAEACASGLWEGSQPASIPLTHWLDRWIPGMIRDQKMVAVFPTPGNKGVIVSPERCRDDLTDELAAYISDEDR